MECEQKRNSHERYSPLTQSPPADWSSNHSSPAKDASREEITTLSKRPPPGASAPRSSKRDSCVVKTSHAPTARSKSQHRSMSCGRAQAVTSSAATLNKPMSNGTFNPRALTSDSTAAMRQAKVAEFENNTIVKQRHELNLLIEELQDRDQELNKMVDSHKQQLLNWEKDRRTILSQDERISRLEGELQLKIDDGRALTSKLRVADSERQQSSTALAHAQEQLRELSEQQSEQLMRADELHARNTQLCNTLMELNKQISQVEGREQELVTLLKLKDKDLLESSKAFGEVTARLKKLEVQNDKSKRHEAEHRRNASEWKNKYNQCWKEYEYYKHEFSKAEQTIDDNQKEMTQLRQENVNLRKELSLATEREKRTEALLDMQKSKQERSDQELQGLRDLYSEQEREIRLLQLNLDGTKEIMVKQQERFAKGMSTSATSTALNTGRSSSPTKSDYQCSLPDALSYQISTLAAPRSRSPYRKSLDADVNAPRMRSPLSRRLTSVKSTSPRRRSDLAAYSPTRMRASSPDVHTGSATSGGVAAAARFVRQRSPENYKRGSPERHAQRLKSMSPARLGSPERLAVHRTGNFSSVPRFELYNNSSNALSDSFASTGGSRDVSMYYDDSHSLPYKSYSSDYRPGATWANTRDLASAADRIMEKYYPRVGDAVSRSLDAAQSDSKVTSGLVAMDNAVAANEKAANAKDDSQSAGGAGNDELASIRRSLSDSFEYADKSLTTAADGGDSAAAAAATGSQRASAAGSVKSDAAADDDAAGNGSVTSHKSSVLDLLLHRDASATEITGNGGAAARQVTSVHSGSGSNSVSSSLHSSLRMTASATAAAASRDGEAGASSDVDGKEQHWTGHERSAVNAVVTSQQQQQPASDCSKADVNKLEKMLSFDSSTSDKRALTAPGSQPSSGRQTPQPMTSQADAGVSSPASSHSSGVQPYKAGGHLTPLHLAADKSPQTVAEKSPQPSMITKADGSALNEQDILVMFAQVHSRIASNKLATRSFSPLMNGSDVHVDAMNTSLNNSTAQGSKRSDTGSELLIDALD